MHRYLTEFLARAAGFQPNAATRIGRYDLETDSPRLSASPFNTTDWPRHFPSPEFLTEQTQLIGGDGDDLYRSIGYFSHSQQDSYAHCGGQLDRDWNYSHCFLSGTDGWPFGHAIHGHFSDFTWWRIGKARRMAKRVFDDMRNIIANANRYPDRDLALQDPNLDDTDPAWTSVRDAVENFIRYPEEVTETLSGFNVTLPGLRNKLRRLDITIPENLNETDPEDRRVLSRLPTVPGHDPRVFRTVVVPRGAEVLTGAFPVQ